MCHYTYFIFILIFNFQPSELLKVTKHQQSDGLGGVGSVGRVAAVTRARPARVTVALSSMSYVWRRCCGADHGIVS